MGFLSDSELKKMGLSTLKEISIGSRRSYKYAKLVNDIKSMSSGEKRAVYFSSKKEGTISGLRNALKQAGIGGRSDKKYRFGTHPENSDILLIQRK